MSAEIPYPPVFHDWRVPEERVSSVRTIGGVSVEMLVSPGTWKRVELTEDDACLYAASLLQRAGRKKLARKVLKGMNP